MGKSFDQPRKVQPVKVQAVSEPLTGLLYWRLLEVSSELDDGIRAIRHRKQETGVCILLCRAEGSLYAGWTFDIEQRIQAHNEGKVASYTRTRLPVRLAASWTFQNKTEAMRFEWQIKRMFRA